MRLYVEHPCELSGHDELVLVTGTVWPHPEGGATAEVEWVGVWDEWTYVTHEPSEDERERLGQALLVMFERERRSAA